MIQYDFKVQGTLAANHTFNFKAPMDLQLINVSCCNSSAYAGTLKIGIAGTAEAYLNAEDFGVSSVPVQVKTPAGFDGSLAGGQYPHIAKDTNVLITITDHVSHMIDVFVTMLCTEG